MADVAQRPRGELYERWRSEFVTIVDKMNDPEDVKSTTRRFLCMHLTWYNSSTSEMFSPIDLQSLLKNRSTFGHVVILIDDIFDMYSRLQGKGHLYDDEVVDAMIDEVASISGLPSARDLEKGALPSWCDDSQQISAEQRDELKAKFKAETRLHVDEAALRHLLAWRHAEMLQAEYIARALECTYTVLGTKHTRKSLGILSGQQRPIRSYLSHRISEPRRANKASITEFMLGGEWNQLTDEVNSLHFRFADDNQLLINPTAIDEFRFNCRPDRRPPMNRLTPRWPTPVRGEIKPKDEHDANQDTLLCDVRAPTPGRDVAARDEQKLLKRKATLRSPAGLPPSLDYESSEVATTVVRSLCYAISSEVPFRDHVIVESTPNLCVYRPFYCEEPPSEEPSAKWSGGVGPEISHWKKVSDLLSQEVTPQDNCEGSSMHEAGDVSDEYVPAKESRRIAFVHTIPEIEARIRGLLSDDNSTFESTIDSHLRGALESFGIPSDDIAELFKQPVDLSLLRRRRDKRKAMKTPENVYDAVLSAAATVQLHAFTQLEKPFHESVSDESIESNGPQENAAKAQPDTVLQLVFSETSERKIVHLSDAGGVLCSFFAADMKADEKKRADAKFSAGFDKRFRNIAGQSLAEMVASKIHVSLSIIEPTDDLRD